MPSSLIWIVENVEYGLRSRRCRRRATARALEALEGVRLDGFEARALTALRWSATAGGLGASIVNRPGVLLLDEPLGAFDLKLREQMQVELKPIQRQVGITFVFVTHDQEEALTMSDRIAVFDAGRVEQVGTPAEVYERPAIEFVAGFVGTSNLLRGEAARASSVKTGCSACGPRRSASRLISRKPRTVNTVLLASSRSRVRRCRHAIRR